ncbi:putative ATP synthase subunit g 2, mitochondrial [Parelaphostrongylus tenuis]|uniref:ATP synthase subunit g 2, mitochondrial n=1 Tax=Parelaphostrongylus tenuis TaxID=148309 RepID=A0AAD5QRQ1_PARTN|nr:putative ATP synthase subunit g 2, mitochondrial [Parelaphostrongylus tenuis]
MQSWNLHSIEAELQLFRLIPQLEAVGKHELAPPKTTDWPAIKADWKKVSDFILTKKYKELTVREFLVYTAVSMEIVFWFFIGE